MCYDNYDSKLDENIVLYRQMCYVITIENSDHFFISYTMLKGIHHINKSVHKNSQENPLLTCGKVGLKKGSVTKHQKCMFWAEVRKVLFPSKMSSR